MPFFSVRNYIDTSASTIPTFIRGREELLLHIRSLEQEISSRQGLDNVMHKLMDENDELRTLLNAAEDEMILAGVMARPPGTPYGVVILDKGSKDGILEDAPVYYGEGKVIGYINKVFKSSSIVTLFSSPDIETSVYIFGPNIFATAYGNGGGIVRISVPQGLVIEKGDVVILPSIYGGILGDVDEVESNPTEPEQHAYLTFDTPIQSIRLVGVGTKQLEEVSLEEIKKTVLEKQKSFLQFDIEELQIEVEATTTPEADNQEISL